MENLSPKIELHEKIIDLLIKSHASLSEMFIEHLKSSHQTGDTDKAMNRALESKIKNTQTAIETAWRQKDKIKK